MDENLHNNPESLEASQDGGVPRPDEIEPLGPLGGLMHASAIELADHMGNDPQIAAEAQLQAMNEGIDAEEEGVEASQLLGMMFATVLSIASLVFALYFLFFVTRRDEAREIAQDVPLSRYVEQRELRAEAQDAYAHYAVSPNTEDRYRIPIDAAMRIVERQSSVGETVPTSRTDFNLAWISLHPAPAVHGGTVEEGSSIEMDSSETPQPQVAQEALNDAEMTLDEVQ